MKTWAVAVLTLVIVAQFAAVGSLIAKHERVLREGTVHRFRTRPIDPADPFQGRYVQLVYERDYIPGTNEKEEAPLHGEHVDVSSRTRLLS